MRTHVQVSDNTVRFSDVGLVTRANVKFTYALVRPEGKVHIINAAIVRWSRHPYPQVTYVTACGGRQYSTVWPQRATDYPEELCCVKCFKLDTTRMVAQMQRRESIFEAVEGWVGKFTYRDIWDKTKCSYSLVQLVITEMRKAGLVTVVSPEGRQPLEMVAVNA